MWPNNDANDNNDNNNSLATQQLVACSMTSKWFTGVIEVVTQVFMFMFFFFYFLLLCAYL